MGIRTREKFTPVNVAGWLLIYTKPNHEYIAHDRLIRTFNCKVYMPRTRERVIIRGKLDWKIRPFLARYLFLQDVGTLVDLRLVYGVSHLIKVGDRAAGISQAVIDRMREREDGDGFITLNHVEKFKPGDRVEVLDNAGNFQFEGVFKSMNNKLRADVFLQHIDQLSSWRVSVPITRLRVVNGND